MNVVFRKENTIYAAQVTEWFADKGYGVAFLNHSEFEEITLENGTITLDGEDVEILEMTPDIRKYI